MIYEPESNIDTKKQKKIRKAKETFKFDTIVIGGSLSGLISTLIIASNGPKVLLLDENKTFGGFNNTINHIHGKQTYTFDIYWPIDLSENSETYGLLKNLDIMDKIKTYCHKIKFELREPTKTPFIFQNNWKHNVSQLKHVYSLSAKAIDWFFQDLKKAHASYDDFQKIFKKFQTASAVLDHYFKFDQQVKHFFEKFWIFFGTPYPQLEAKIFVYNLMHYLIGGFYYIQGYSKKMSDVIEEAILSLGSNVKKNIKPLQLLTNNHSAKSLLTFFNEKPKKIKAERFIISTNLSDLAYNLLSNNKEPRTEKYRKYAKNNLVARLVEVHVLVGLVKNPRVYKITNPIYYFSKASTSTKAWELIQIDGFKKSPILLFNQNELYPNDQNQKIGALFIKLYFSSIQILVHEEIKQHVKCELMRQFPELQEKDIAFIEVYYGKQLAKRKDYKNSFGFPHTKENGWNNRPYSTPFRNVILANSDSFPGGRGNSEFLTAAFSCSAVNVNLKKGQMHGKLDHYHPRQLLEYICQFYKPNPKHFKKTIGFTIDERYHFQIKLTKTSAVIQEVSFEVASKSVYFVWIFSAVLKDLLSHRAKMKTQIIANRMRVKGGAVYFSKLVKSVFPNSFYIESQPPKKIKQKDVRNSKN